MTTTLLLLSLWTVAEIGADTAVVCPQEFCRALEPWLKHRQEQGHRIEVISNSKSPEAAGSLINAICLPSGDQTGDWSVSTLGSRKRSDFSCTSYTAMKA